MEALFFIIFCVGVFHIFRFILNVLSTGKLTSNKDEATRSSIFKDILHKLNAGVSKEELKKYLEEQLTEKPAKAKADLSGIQLDHSPTVTHETAEQSEPKIHQAQKEAVYIPRRQSHKKELSFNNWYADNSINLLLYIGAFFIVMAAIAFLGFTWDQLSGILRFLVLAAITIAFGAAGTVFYNQKKIQQAGITFLGISGLLLPINGVAFQQFVLQSPENIAPLWIITSAVCLSYYIFLFILIPTRFMAGIIHLSSLSLVSAFIYLTKASPEWYIFGAIVTSFLVYCANFLHLKKISSEIRSFNDTSSQAILIISVIYGFFTTLNSGSFFTWPTVAALLLSAAYYVMRWLLGEKRSFPIAAVLFYVTYIVGICTATGDAETQQYLLLIPPLAYYFAANVFCRNKNGIFETKISAGFAIGASWIATAVALIASNLMTSPLISIALLLGSAVHLGIYRFYRQQTYLFWMSVIQGYLAFAAFYTFQKRDLSLQITLQFSLFIIAEVIAQLLWKTKPNEARWLSWITTAAAGLYTAISALSILENTAWLKPETTILLISAIVYSGFTMLIRNRAYAAPLYTALFFLIWHLTALAEVSRTSVLIALYAYVSALVIATWYGMKRNYFNKDVHTYLFWIPSFLAACTQLGILGDTYTVTDDESKFLVPFSFALTAGFSALNYYCWNALSYIPMLVFSTLALLSFSVIQRLNNSYLTILFSSWTLLHLYASEYFKKTTAKKLEHLSHLVTSTVSAMLLFILLSEHATSLQTTLYAFIWVHFMLAIFFISKYRIYLYFYLAAMTIHIPFLDGNVISTYLGGYNTSYILYSGAALLTLYFLKKYPAYRKGLFVASGVYFLMIYISSWTGEETAVNKNNVLVASLLAIPISVYLWKQWNHKLARLAPVVASYIPVFAAASVFNTGDYVSLGMVLVSAIQFLLAPYLVHYFDKNFTVLVQKINLAVAILFTLIEFGTSLEATQTLQILHCFMVIVCATMLTEYWRRNQNRYGDYIAGAAWVLALLRIFMFADIDNIQFYIQPIAIYIFAVGLYNKYLNRSSWGAFLIGGMVISIGSLFLSSWGDTGFWYALILVLEGLGLLALGISINIQKIRTGGAVAVAVGIFSQSAPFLLALPWWIWLGITGLIILGAATTLLAKRK